MNALGSGKAKSNLALWRSTPADSGEGHGQDIDDLVSATCC